MHRRAFLKHSVFGTAFLALASFLPVGLSWAEDLQKIDKPNSEWKKILTPEQFDILRRDSTEAPYTSPLNDEHHKGIFACVACDLPLFKSETKFDSGTGWPSFYDHIPGHIETSRDLSLFVPRTEYHCARCGGHHGHIFDDGPKPTGLRHCNNGAVLKFIAS
jgi:peptide-methionine (R)-S-oxide reductase